jgi:pimeloyl-ACP methyl ester carboxylesterase
MTLEFTPSEHGWARCHRSIETELPSITKSMATVRRCLVVGTDDTPFLAASDYMAAKIPGAQKVVIPSAGRAVNVDQPQAFVDVVVPFLKDLPQEAGRERT